MGENKPKEKKKSILVLCAHCDDHIFGPGGAIIKYAREGHTVNTIICTYGEKSHPHYKPEIIRKIRVREARRVNKFIGGKHVVFLGLPDMNFIKGIKEKQENLEKYIRKLKPDIIFTHAIDEIHKDHKDTNRIARRIYEHMGLKCEMYSFDVWNIINFKQGIRIKLVVDISDTFRDKIRALNMFKSQKIQALIPLLWSVYLKAMLNGFNHGTRFAEVFYKIK